jgi:hypothetical protein
VELLSGKLASFVALFRQRKEITRQHEMLRLKDRHMGILAHDLKAPVATALETARQLLRHEDLHVRIAAERIARSTVHMQQPYTICSPPHAPPPPSGYVRSVWS